MKKFLLLPFLLLAVQAPAKERLNIAEDDAGSYNEGWKTDGNGSGFGNWSFQTQTAEGVGESHAGVFIAESANNSDMGAVAIKDKAFGMFANGNGFEAAAAFRSFKKALGIGESFSFLMKSGQIEKKFENDDPALGSIGLTLRTGNENGKADEYNKGARFEFGYYEGQNNYQIYDGSEKRDSGVPFTDEGISVTVTLVTADTYDLEITTLQAKKTTKLSGRKLGGTGAIESFCVFNRDGEKTDAYFNGFQVSTDAK